MVSFFRRLKKVGEEKRREIPSFLNSAFFMMRVLISVAGSTITYPFWISTNQVSQPSVKIKQHCLMLTLPHRNPWLHALKAFTIYSMLLRRSKSQFAQSKSRVNLYLHFQEKQMAMLELLHVVGGRKGLRVGVEVKMRREDPGDRTRG